MQQPISTAGRTLLTAWLPVLSPPPLLRLVVLQQDKAEPAENPDNHLFRALINIQAVLKKYRDRMN